MTSADRVPAGSLLDRRGFIKASALAAGGLMVSLYLERSASAQGGALPPPKIYPPDAFGQIRAE